MRNVSESSIPDSKYEYPSTHATTDFSTDDVGCHTTVTGRRRGLPASTRWEEAVGNR